MPFKAGPEAHREYSRQWHIANRERISARQKKWYLDNKQKTWARNIVLRAVKKGDLVRPEVCERCGTDGTIDGHHFDYSKPLEVLWLCRSCHRREHAQEKKAA